MNNKCLQCKKAVKSKLAKYCSVKCKREYYKTEKDYNTVRRFEKTCKLCNKKFLAQKANGQFCSMACFRKEEANKTKLNRITKKCIVCQKDFETKRSRDAIFCSKKCVGQRFKPQNFIYNCQECSAPLKEHQIKNRQSYCSAACAKKNKVQVNLPVAIESKAFSWRWELLWRLADSNTKDIMRKIEYKVPLV